VTLTAYRITKAAFAGTMWSGIGARDYGGRWNSKGVAVVYAAENRSLAAMEQLVHLVKPRVLRGYMIASIELDEALLMRVDARSLPANWSDPVAPALLKSIGDGWVAAAKHLSLAVPSAVIPGEWNYLINPAHSAFAKCRKSKPVPFIYDDRLV
jgi:RES domain-containing protein